MNDLALGACPHCGQHHTEDVLVCPVKHEQMPLPGRLLAGKFRFERLLGEGGMGSVWAAQNVLVRKAVAIKLMRPEFSSNPAILGRFRNEATAAGQIGSPHICDILDFGQSELGPYIVMELMRGRALSELIEQSGRLDPGLAVIILRQTLEGLDAAHRAGIIHRDLKPENIFLSEPAPGRLLVKLMDFGISKFTQAASESGRTGVGVLMGTPEYMSPEQSQGAANVNERTDIWAMGLILYKALSGVDAFAGPTVAATLVAIATRDPPPLEEYVPGLHPGLIEIIRRCTAKEPSHRFASARELSDALAPYESLSAMLPPMGPSPAGPAPMTTPPQTAAPVGPAHFTAARTFSAGPLATGQPASTFTSELSAPTVPSEESWSLGAHEIDDERPDRPSSHERDKGGGRSKAPILIVLLLAVVGAAVGGYLVFGRDKPPVVDPAPDNAAAGASAAASAGAAGASGAAQASAGDPKHGDTTGDSTGDTTGDTTGAPPVQPPDPPVDPPPDPPTKTKTPTKTAPKKNPAPKDSVAGGNFYTPKTPGETMARSMARDYCKKLEHGGRDDWQLANVSEAQNFKGKAIPRVLYWTEEMVGGTRDMGRAINMRNNEVSERPISDEARPLCVVRK
ncbi:MAG: serine/threonine protein kinase [Nannocystis sp.]|nr:serine/threonine protein kinase [Nannocystis sp.]